MVRAYRQEGAAGLISKRRGLAGNHRHDDGIKAAAMELVHQHYAGFGSTLAAEKWCCGEQRDITAVDDNLWTMGGKTSEAGKGPSKP
jgi:glutathione S-transferase